MLRHFTCQIRIPHPRLPLETCIIQPIYPDEIITLQITAIHVTCSCTYVFTHGVGRSGTNEQLRLCGGAMRTS